MRQCDPERQAEAAGEAFPATSLPQFFAMPRLGSSKFPSESQSGICAWFSQVQSPQCNYQAPMLPFSTLEINSFSTY
jgi:hypothetical protein